MPSFGSITVSQTDKIARAVSRWPAPAGCISSDVLRDFEQLVDWLEDEHPCHAVVLSIAPSELDGRPASVPDADQCSKWEKLLVRVDRLPCVSVAVVDGPCHRFWMQLALACDHRIATVRSSFQVLELKEGYLPGMNMFRLAKYMGIGGARRLAFTGDPLDGAAAAACGVVDELCEPRELDRVVDAFLGRLAPIHPVAAQLARRLLNESFSTAFEQFLGQYLAAQHRCLSDRNQRPEQDPSAAR